METVKLFAADTFGAVSLDKSLLASALALFIVLLAQGIGAALIALHDFWSLVG